MKKKLNWYERDLNKSFAFVSFQQHDLCMSLSPLSGFILICEMSRFN